MNNEAVVAEKQLDMRLSGIDVIGAVPWGTHFCEFYNTSQDLIETLVPYFISGLKSNEFCMWVTSTPLQVKEALTALQEKLPDINDYLARDQLEILDYAQWYLPDGAFDADKVLKGWSEKLADARSRGFEGLRLSGNTFWLEKSDWEDFTRYEEKVNSIIGNQRMIALCTYSLEKCGVREILEVVANHQFALIKTQGRWEIIESAEHEKIEHALRESEERYRTLFTQMNEGFALHEIICDDEGKPVDYRFLDVNPAFQQYTGLSREDVIDKTVLEVLPNIESFWIETYGKVALGGKPIHFQNLAGALGRFFDVMAFSPRYGQFAALFIDITEHKALEEKARDSAAHIAMQHRLNEQRERERLQIAQELHDGPIQVLTSATYILESILMDKPEPAIVQDLENLRILLTEQITSLRAFSQELRPPILVQFGLEKAIKAQVENFQAKHPDLLINIDTKPAGILPDSIQHGVYRIFQEALQNISRHAQASQVDINMNIIPGTLEISIRDNGIGFDPPKDWLALAGQGHLGLVGIRERADAMGGKITISSNPGKGTCLTLTVPTPSEGVTL